MATPVRASIEAELVRFWGRHMHEVGLDISATGSNLDLNMPMRDALMAVGIVMADPMIVADVDFVNIMGPRLVRLLIVAQLRLIELIEARWGYTLFATQRNLNLEAPEDRPKILEFMFKDLLKRKADLEREILKPLRTAPSSTPGMVGQPISGQDLNAQGFPLSCTYRYGPPYLP